MKSTLWISFISIVAFACSGSNGATGAPGANGVNGSSCHVTDTEDGTAIIFCDDGSQAVIQDGLDGEDGMDGSDGEDGTNGEDGLDGEDGEPGAPGEDGSDAEAIRIVEGFICAGNLPNQNFQFTYNAWLLSSGDLFVTGAIISDAVSVDTFAIYTPDEPDYPFAPVAVTLDQGSLQDGGWFGFRLPRADPSDLVLNIEYYSSAQGSLTTSWNLEACKHGVYGQDE